MDKIKRLSMIQDIHFRMQKELNSLWTSLKNENREDIRKKLLKINNLAFKIGGAIQRDVEQLQRDVHRFWSEGQERHRIFQDALKLKHETREL